MLPLLCGSPSVNLDLDIELASVSFLTLDLILEQGCDISKMNLGTVGGSEHRDSNMEGTLSVKTREEPSLLAKEAILSPTESNFRINSAYGVERKATLPKSSSLPS